MHFDELSHDGQVAVAAWSVLLASDPPRNLRWELRQAREEGLLPDGISRVLGDLCTVIGLRTRGKRHNHQRRNDINPRAILKKARAPKRRPSKRKVTV